MKQSVTCWLILLGFNLLLQRITAIPIAWLTLPYLLIIPMRKYLFRKCPEEYRLAKDEVVIVTGASSGIGTEVAKQCLERGGTVILACRNVAAARAVVEESSKADRARVMSLDLSDLVSIEKFAKEIASSYRHVDVLILNAGVNNSQRRITKDGFEETIGVNHLGHMYLTYLLRNQLCASHSHPRVTVVSSDLHRLPTAPNLGDLMFEKGYSGWTAYNHSKLLNMLFVRKLSFLWKNQINVNAAHPGTPIFTGLMRQYKLFTMPVISHFIRLAAFLHTRTIWEGAQTILYASLCPDALTYTGLYFENCQIVNPSTAAVNNDYAEEVWDWSCEKLKISPEKWNSVLLLNSVGC